MNKNLVIILCVIVMIAMLLPSGGKQRSVMGISEPVQKPASGGETLAIKGYEVKLSFLYSYDIEALVVHKKKLHRKSHSRQISTCGFGFGVGVGGTIQ